MVRWEAVRPAREESPHEPRPSGTSRARGLAGRAAGRRRGGRRRGVLRRGRVQRTRRGRRHLLGGLRPRLRRGPCPRRPGLRDPQRVPEGGRAGPRRRLRTPRGGPRRGRLHRRGRRARPGARGRAAGRRAPPLHAGGRDGSRRRPPCPARAGRRAPVLRARAVARRAGRPRASGGRAARWRRARRHRGVLPWGHLHLLFRCLRGVGDAARPLGEPRRLHAAVPPALRARGRGGRGPRRGGR